MRVCSASGEGKAKVKGATLKLLDERGQAGERGDWWQWPREGEVNVAHGGAEVEGWRRASRGGDGYKAHERAVDRESADQLVGCNE